MTVQEPTNQSTLHTTPLGIYVVLDVSSLLISIDAVYDVVYIYH
jgi:hypothetical protein